VCVRACVCVSVCLSAIISSVDPISTSFCVCYLVVRGGKCRKTKILASKPAETKMVGNNNNVFPKIVPTREFTTKIEKNFFSFSRSWPWAYFLNGPNAVASVTPILIRQCLLYNFFLQLHCMQQLSRFRLTQRVARSLCGGRASCYEHVHVKVMQQQVQYCMYWTQFAVTSANISISFVLQSSQAYTCTCRRPNISVSAFTIKTLATG